MVGRDPFSFPRFCPYSLGHPSNHHFLSLWETAGTGSRGPGCVSLLPLFFSSLFKLCNLSACAPSVGELELELL